MASSKEIIPQTFYKINQDLNSSDDTPLTLTSNTHLLTFRTPLPSDFPALTALLTNPANTADDLSVSNQTPLERKAMLASWSKPTQPPKSLNFVILASGTPIGITGIGWIGPYKKGDEKEEFGGAGAVGVMLDPGARGKGYAFEALRISIDYGLRELGLLEMRVGTTSRNLAMRGLMERKFGIKAEVCEADRFGNDLVWRIGREGWLTRKHE